MFHTAGDLSPNMVGKRRIRLEYEGTQLEGLLTELRVDTTRSPFRTRSQEVIRESYDVSLSFSVGGISLTEVKLSHPIEVAGEVTQ